MPLPRPSKRFKGFFKKGFFILPSKFSNVWNFPDVGKLFFARKGRGKQLRIVHTPQQKPSCKWARELR